MRITLEIENYVMDELKKEAHRTGKPVKTVINDLLREGLKRKKDPEPPKPYKCKSFSLGTPSRINLDKAIEIAGSLEDKETARKLTLIG